MDGRTYFHVDMDAFFVSVEELFDPSLKGLPVVVGGRPDQRGVVAAASYAARQFGVHSALPLRTAYKLCPQAIFLDGHMERYREYSHRAHEVMCRFSPLVEMASIDEAYLDMTGTERLHGPPYVAAHKLHETMKKETGLNCSIGVASARVVAKICSDQAKPNGVLWILPGEEASFLAPLEVGRVPGIGKVTEARLHCKGWRTVGDLQRAGAAALRDELGEWGLSLYEKACGRDGGGWFAGEIGEEEEAKSIGHEHTLPVDSAEAELLESILSRLSQKVCRRLREQQLQARRVQLKLRYKDFSTITRSRTLAEPTQLDQELFAAVRRLFYENWKQGSAVRLLGVQCSLFEPMRQASMFDEESSGRQLRAMTAADQLRDRFGEGVVALGKGMQLKMRERPQENPAALPGSREERQKRR
jgi:DNA polymerase-4